MSQVFAATLNGVIAVVFALSAFQKFREPEIAAEAIRRFGFGRRTHRSAALALGGVEAGLALAYVATGDARPRVAACGLLALFAVLLARAAARGELLAERRPLPLPHLSGHVRIAAAGSGP